MSGIDGVWGSEHDAAWRVFAAGVTSKLEDDGWGIVEVEVMTAGTEDNGARPWITVSEEAGAYAAAVSGNDLLASRHRLDVEQERRLEEMGFREEEAGAEGESWWRREAGPDDLPLLVQLVIRALREVFGVVHPALLDWDGAAPAPAGSDPVLRFPPRPQACVVWPGSATELQALVDDVVAEWLGHEPVKDDDGDIPIVQGESMLFVQVAPDRARVDLFSVVVRDVRHRAAARREANLLNRKNPGQTYWVAGDRVLMRRCVSAEPFVAPQLSTALDDVCRRLDGVARDLAERVGGVPFLSDAEGVT